MTLHMKKIGKCRRSAGVAAGLTSMERGGFPFLDDLFGIRAVGRARATSGRPDVMAWNAGRLISFFFFRTSFRALFVVLGYLF
jgi:hypothetical protein